MEQTNTVAIKRKRRKNNGHMRNEGIGYEIFKIFNYAFMIFIILITLVPYLNVFAKYAWRNNNLSPCIHNRKL